MRAWWIWVGLVACGKQQEAPGTGSGSAAVPAAADAAAPADAAMVDTAPAIDAAAAGAPTTKTGIEIVSFEGLNLDKLLPLARGWIAWIEQHFTKCETDAKVEPVTTTVTITFKEGADVKFDLPKVPEPLAECIKKNITTPYLGYEPMPPKSLGKTTLKINLKIGEKAPPPPPDTSPVKYVASKIKGAHDKKEIDKWLEANVARKLKPCIEATAVVQDLWKIGFEVDAKGKMTKATAAGDPNVATCAQKALDALTAPKASGSTTVELVFTPPK